MKRPILKYSSILLLCQIDEYIRRYCVRGEHLENSASDVLDGAVFREEVEELIRKRYLRVLREYDPFERLRVYSRLCGRGWTVHLTDKAMRRFWRKRMS